MRPARLKITKPRLQLMLICWLFYIHIPLLNAATMTPTVWMVICSSQGVHWVAVDLGSDDLPQTDSCHCLLKQLDTATVVLVAPPRQTVVVATQVPAVSYRSPVYSHYAIRAPPPNSPFSL